MNVRTLNLKYQKVICLIPGLVTIKSLLVGCLTSCGQVNHVGILSAKKVNSAFHPFGVRKSITNLLG